MDNTDLCFLYGMFGGIIVQIIFEAIKRIIRINKKDKPKNKIHHIQIVKDATKTTITRI